MSSLRPRSVDFKSSWENNCSSQLRSLFRNDSSCSLSAITLYSHIYELCISFPENHTMSLLQNISQLFFDSAVNIRQNILDSQNDEALLSNYVSEWQNYCSAFKSVNGVCRYLNKCIRANYETAQYPAGSNEGDSEPSSSGLHFQPVYIKVGSSDKAERVELKITCVEDVARSVWTNVILRYFREKQNNKLINTFIRSLRQVHVADVDLKHFIESFKWCNDVSLIEVVEANTRTFYADLSRKFISEHGVGKYVAFATDCLATESNRSKELWSDDYELIVRACEIELIENHKTQLQEEFEKMLKSEVISDISTLYRLLSKNEGTTTTLQLSLKNLIFKEFDMNTASSRMDDVKNIQSVFKKYSELINKSFANEPKILSTLDESMAFILNKKISNAGNLFSRFIDESLRNGVLTPETVSIIQVFCANIEAFDEFVSDYKVKLAQRLIFHDTNVNDEERVIEIFRWAEKLSPEQSCHLTRMLLDHKEKTLSVLVLTSHAWPSTCDPRSTSTIIRDPSLMDVIQKFEEDYKDAHCGRRLQWCPHLFTLETQNGTVMSLLQYELISQMPFNNPLEVGERLSVSQKEIALALKSLQEHGIVQFDPQSNVVSYVHLPGQLNVLPKEDLESALIESSSVGIIDFIQQEQENCSARHLRQSFILQSVISSILKQQRQCSPAEMRKLVISSTESLKHGHAFVPNYEDIETAVNGLLGKGYLEFNAHENIYIYVP